MQWGGVGRRGCRVALGCVLSLKLFGLSGDSLKDRTASVISSGLMIYIRKKPLFGSSCLVGKQLGLWVFPSLNSEKVTRAISYLQ